MSHKNIPAELSIKEAAKFLAECHQFWSDSLEFAREKGTDFYEYNRVDM